MGDPSTEDNEGGLLFEAATVGNYSRVQELIKRGLHANVKGRDGRTPLHLACENDHMETSKFLILNDCIDLDTKDHFYEKTPLHCACNMDLMQLLLGRGAKVNMETKQGHTTPLHLASERNHSEVL